MNTISTTHATRRSARSSPTGNNRPKAGVERLQDRLLFCGFHAAEPIYGDPPSHSIATLAASESAGETSLVPTLNSRPGSSKRLILDFDGDTPRAFSNYSVPATPAFSLDGATGTYSSADLAAITQIWQMVAEKFAAFDINVTTVVPGSLTPNADAKMIIGGTDAWTGQASAGVSYTYGFVLPSFYPNWGYVFPASLSNHPAWIADAVAHESGHLFGLVHQRQYSGSTLVAEYYAGDSQRAPIMGRSYNAARGLWWHGTSGPGAMQDDLSMLTSTLGLVADVQGQTTGTAGAATVVGTALSASGLINSSTDADYFSFTTSGGLVSFTGSIAPYGGMLDMKLELRDSAGNLVASANTASLGETLSANVAAGTYYIVVASAGNYGDIGQYTLTGTLPSGGGTVALSVDAGSYTVTEGATVSVSASVLTGSASSFAWDLDGDGVFGETGAGATRGNETGQTVTFNAAGLDGPSSYSIALRATAADSTVATDTASISITNNAPAIQTPGAAPSSPQEGSPITFTLSATDPGTDTITSWLINWGDGTTSTVAGGVTTVEKTYADHGTYTITLTATDEDGSYTTTRTITVANVAPTLTLTAPATANEGTAVSVTFGETDPGSDTVTTWVINWGDGTTTTYAGSLTSGSKTYADNGTYTVTLTATDEDGSYSTTRSITVLNVAPSLTLNLPTTVNEGSSASYTFSRTDLGTDTISSWVINWGDGTTSTLAAAATSASKTYADDGTYTITLTATDEDGTYSTTRSVTVLNVAPTLTLTAPSSANEMSSVAVTFSKVDPGADTITSWVIDWGDGTTTGALAASATGASKTYTDNGTYTMTLTATDGDGSYSITRTITVSNVAPTLTFTVPSTGSEGSVFSVNMAASDVASDTITAWTIAWGDGTTSTLGASATGGTTKTYADNGTYTVTLTATDEDGSYTASRTIIVANVAPVLTLSAAATGSEGTAIPFTFSAADVGSDTISAWLITWGDGTTSSLAGSATSTTKTYADNGTYTVTLRGTDEDGQFTTTRSITITNSAPVITPTTPANVYEGTNFAFDWSVLDAGTDTISAWSINWGDGTTSSLAGSARTVTKKFADNGTYTVTLTATDEDGTTTKATSVVVQNVAPNVAWTPATTAAQGDVYSFTWTASDVGTDTLSGWTIDWGDGQTSSLGGAIRTASHTYATAGAKTVQLVATDEDGSYTRTATVTVGASLPIITATPSATTIDEGDTLSLAFSASNRTSAMLSGWRIDWGDGTVVELASTASTASHTYSDNGAFSIQVTAIEPGDIETTKTVALTVNNVAPVLSITTSADWVTAGAAFSMSVSGSGFSTGPVTSYVVSWGDGTTSTYSATQKTFTKTYTKPGTYTPVVTAMDSAGGTVATAEEVDVLAKPTATITPIAKVTGITTQIFVDVTYTSPGGIAQAQFDGTDLVLGGMGTGVKTNVHSATSADGGKTWKVRYRLTRTVAWTLRDNGAYTVGISPTAAKDLLARGVTPPTAASLVIAIKPPDFAGNELIASRSLGDFSRGKVKKTVDAIGPFDKIDYYKLRLTSGGQLNIKLYDLESTADLKVYDGNGNQIASSARGGASTESISLTRGKGIVYIRVSDTKGTGTDYSLRTELLQPGSTATPDLGTAPGGSTPAPSDLAGNDTANPYQLGYFDAGRSRTLSDVVSSSDRNDFFRLRMMSAGRLDLSLTGLSSDVDLHVLDGSGNVIATASRGGASNESLSLNLNGGWYFVRVLSRSTTPSSYRMDVKHSQLKAA